jgi:hypothetical protein
VVAGLSFHDAKVRDQIQHPAPGCSVMLIARSSVCVFGIVCDRARKRRRLQRSGLGKGLHPMS